MICLPIPVVGDKESQLNPEAEGSAYKPRGFITRSGGKENVLDEQKF